MEDLSYKKLTRHMVMNYETFWKKTNRLIPCHSTFWSTESESNPDPSFRDDTLLSCHHFPSPPQRKRYVPDMREEEMDGGVHQKILEISQLPSTAAVAGDYGNVRYLAQQLLSPWRDRDFKQDMMPWTCYRCNKQMHVFISKSSIFALLSHGSSPISSRSSRW